MVFRSAFRKLVGRCGFRSCALGVSLTVCLLSLALIPVPAQAEQWQKLNPQGYINDFAGVLDSATVGQLTRLCTEVDQKAKAQIALTTIKSLEGEPVEDFANHLFQKWGVGYKGTDRGVMVLLAINDHKYWTEVGYGLEPILPDGKVGDFGRAMVPLLRQGDYNHAALQIVSQIAEVIAQDSHVSLDSLPQSANAPPSSASGKDQEQPLTVGEIVGFLVILTLGAILFKLFGPWFLLSLIFGGGGRGRSDGWGGGGFGGGGGGFGGGSSGGGGAGGSW